MSSLTILKLSKIVVLNIIYWNNLLNLYSIVLGTLNIITFMQTKASTIRKYSVVTGILSIIYYILLNSPINAITDTVGLISTIIGIIRLDVKKKEN